METPPQAPASNVVEAAPPLRNWKCERILVVVDPGAEHHAGIHKAMRLALGFRSTVELFICDTEQSVPECLAGELTAFEYRRHLRRRYLRKIENLAGPLRAAGLVVTAATEWGVDLATGVEHHAIQSHADLVIKDTHHHLHTPRLVSSQTDTTLIRQLTQTLLLVHDSPWPSTLRVAAAIDPAHPDDLLVEAASSLADKLSGTLETVSVLREPTHFPETIISKAQRKIAYEKARMQVAAVVQRHDPSTHMHFPDRPVAQSLLSFIEHQQPDILIMGVASRPHRLEASRGGMPARLLENLECDLLVIKQLDPTSTVSADRSGSH